MECYLWKTSQEYSIASVCSNFKNYRYNNVPIWGRQPYSNWPIWGEIIEGKMTKFCEEYKSSWVPPETVVLGWSFCSNCKSRNRRGMWVKRGNWQSCGLCWNDPFCSQPTHLWEAGIHNTSSFSCSLHCLLVIQIFQTHTKLESKSGFRFFKIEINVASNKGWHL